MLNELSERVVGDLSRPFALAGRRCYLVGCMDGSFPDMGNHMPGEMGGLWTQPIKLADGFWLGLSAYGSDVQWMHGGLPSGPCLGFTMRPGIAERDFTLAISGIEITARQELFVPDEEPGLLIGLTLTSAHDVELTLSWLVRFDIQGAWWSNWPDRPDAALFDPASGAVVANDTLTDDWCAAMVADRAPTQHEIGTQLWAAERTGSLHGSRGGWLVRNPDEIRGQGISARLDYRLALAAGVPQSVHFAIAGGMDGPSYAQAKAVDLLARREEFLSQKLQSQRLLAEGWPVLRSPQPGTDRIFAHQNLCMDLLTLDLPGLGRGIVAGLPEYAWFFGCDTYYSVGGLLITGQARTALGNLRILGRYAGGQGGRVPHEISPGGDLFNPGNTVETSQFVTAVERTYRWTGDRAFLDEMYALCKRGLFDYMLGECDPKGDLLPDGPGLLELRTAEHGKKLDVACSLFQALHSLAYMATALDDGPTARRCLSLAAEVRQRIDRYFWVEERQAYVWRIEQDLSAHPDEPAHSYAALEMGLLGEGDRDRIDLLFNKIEGPEHTGPRGAIHPGTADFVMPIQNAIIALAEFRYGRPDKGLWYMERMADEYGYYMPWAIPEFIGRDACFLQAWSSAAYNWLMVQGFFRLNPDPTQGVVIVQPQLAADWDSLQVKNLAIWGGRYDLRLLRSKRGILFDAEARAPGSGVRFKVELDPKLPATFV